MPSIARSLPPAETHNGHKFVTVDGAQYRIPSNTELMIMRQGALAYATRQPFTVKSGTGTMEVSYSDAENNAAPQPRETLSTQEFEKFYRPVPGSMRQYERTAPDRIHRAEENLCIPGPQGTHLLVQEGDGIIFQEGHKLGITPVRIHALNPLEVVACYEDKPYRAAPATALKAGEEAASQKR